MALRKPIRLVSSIILSGIIVVGCSEKKNESQKSPPPTEGESRSLPNPAPAPAEALIEPGSGIDKVRKGMTGDDVLSAFGKPDSNKSGFWVYKNKGFAVGINKSNALVNIHCLASFRGKTKEGIGIGSTATEIVQAYGEPKEKKVVKDHDVMYYTNPRILFSLKNDKVYQIVLDLQSQ